MVVDDSLKPRSIFLSMAAHRLYVHLAWTTRGRRPMINATTRDLLESYFRRIAAREGVEIMTSAVLRTHVHLLIRVQPKVDIPHFVQAMKGGSSYLVNRTPGNILGLRWAREYSATTVSPKQLSAVQQYLARQAVHHPGEGIPG